MYIYLSCKMNCIFMPIFMRWVRGRTVVNNFTQISFGSVILPPLIRWTGFWLSGSYITRYQVLTLATSLCFRHEPTFTPKTPCWWWQYCRCSPLSVSVLFENECGTSSVVIMKTRTWRCISWHSDLWYVGPSKFCWHALI